MGMGGIKHKCHLKGSGNRGGYINHQNTRTLYTDVMHGVVV